MTGVPPFSDESPEAVFDNILALQLDWPSETDGDEPLTEDVVEVILSLLKLDPAERISFTGLKNLPYFVKVASGEYWKVNE